MGLEFGKLTTHESYFDGKLKSTKTEFELPELIKDKAHALSVVMKCLDLIDKRETNNVVITIKADPTTGNIKLITKRYTIC